MSRRHDSIALAILALLAALVFSDVLLGLNQLYVRDIAAYYFPAKKVLREIVLGGEFPFWNRFFAAGQPMAANPEHEVFYPPTWLILLPDYLTGLTLLMLGHVFLALGAMYALLRSMRCGVPASFLGALAFGLGGIVLSALAFLPILFSLAWLPLSCLFVRRWVVERRRRDLALAAVCLGLQMLAGEPVTMLQSAMIIGAWAVWRGARGGAGAASRAAGAALAAGLLGAALAAVQLVPAVDHARDSVRARGFEAAMSARMSMPPLRVAEIFYPNALGHMSADGRTVYWAQRLYPGTAIPFYLSLYSGLLVAVLTVAGLAGRSRGTGLTLALAAVSLVLAAGNHTPLFQLLHESGIFGSIRYPEKFALTAIFAAIVFSSRVLDQLLGGDERLRRLAFRTAGGLALVTAAFTAFALSPAWEPFFVGLWKPHRLQPVAEMLALSRRDWLIAAARCVLLALLLRNLFRVKSRVAAALLGSFVLLDLGTTLPEIAPRVPSSFYRTPPAAVRHFPQEKASFRVFHQAGWDRRSPFAMVYTAPHPDLPWILRNGLFPPNLSAWGLQSAIEPDFDLTALLPTTDFVRSAWELSAVRPADWTSIVSSMSNVRYRGVFRDPRRALADAGGDPRDIEPVQFLEEGAFPRYYFASEMIPVASREEFVAAVASRPFRPRAAFVNGEAFEPAGGRVLSWSEGANEARIEVETRGRAFLVMSVTPHKYWRVTIDGTPVTPVVTNVGYQGVAVPAGRHRVEMRYRNPLVAAGGAASLSALAVVVLLCLRRRRIGAA